MQPVPASYQPYRDVRRISVRAVFELIDVDAADTAAATGSTGEFFAKLPQTHDKITEMTRRVATLEPGYWLLNGGYSTVAQSGDNGEVGYWSGAISDAAGNINITLTFSFTADQDSDGITVIFDERTGECASDFVVTVYNGANAVIKTVTVTGNTEAVRVVSLGAENYRKVTLRFTKTNNPYRRIRVCEVVFGYLQSFDDDGIASLSVQYASTIDSQSLPSGGIALTIDNTARQYNIINPTGIYKYLQKGQGLNVSVGIDGESVSLGRFYFDNAQSDDNAMTATIYAYDRLYSMDRGVCNIGATGAWTVAQAVAAVIADSGLEITTSIPAGIAGTVIGKGIPQNTSHREALRLIAQAARCVCYFNRLDVLTFLTPAIGDSVDALDNNNMAEYPQVRDTGLINAIQVTARNEYEDNAQETVYYAQNIASDETERLLSVNNPLVTSQGVADWLLQMARYRVGYTIRERGNPARDIQDVVTIHDVYGANKGAIVIKETINVATGLTGDLEAVTI